MIIIKSDACPGSLGCGFRAIPPTGAKSNIFEEFRLSIGDKTGQFQRR